MIYVGDGSSDVHVMLHVNNHDGFTIAVSENKQLARIAQSTVLSDNAFSIMVPILDQLLHWRTGSIRELFESYGLTLNEWEKDRTDRVKISEILSIGRASGSRGGMSHAGIELLGWAATAVFVGSYFFCPPITCCAACRWLGARSG